MSLTQSMSASPGALKHATKTLTVTEFIDQFLINNFPPLFQSHPYHAFILVTTGIELIGKCLDDKAEFDDKDKSKDHFNRATQKYLKKYDSLKLYDPMRCGFSHIYAMRSHSSVILCNGKAVLPDVNLHPYKLDKTKTVIYLEDFYNDFKKACKDLLDDIKNHNIPDPKGKLAKPFIEIGQ